MDIANVGDHPIKIHPNVVQLHTNHIFEIPEATNYASAIYLPAWGI